MIDYLGAGTVTGYCTNVHAGASYAQMRANLQRYALAVKARICPAGPMGVGLWLSRQAVSELREPKEAGQFATWLSRHGLLPFTLNGFPYGDFHRPVVKYDVYRPDWSDVRRLDYTIDLIQIHAQLLGDLDEGSISTLPLGWGRQMKPEAMDRAAGHLLEVAEHLAGIEERSGKLIHLDLEPEPGCRLTESSDVVDLFNRYLLPRGEPEQVRRYLRICHDTCHGAVMFEDQATILDRYRSAGLAVGKVQLSSAVHAPFDSLDAAGRDAAWRQLRSFHEPRYLHQTVVRTQDGGSRFYDDLPVALAAEVGLIGANAWRVHFHVPLFLEQFGRLQTTQNQVRYLLDQVRQGRLDVHHLEAETYAWDVLPDELRTGDLSASIARELQWLGAHQRT